MTEEQLSALLRIKRHEKPPEHYFDRLLEDIHRRQRAELLHRPLWRIALDRVQNFIGEHRLNDLSYAGAMAATLVAGLGAIFFAMPGGVSPARTSAVATAAAPSLQPGSLLSLQSIGPALPAAFDAQTAQLGRGFSQKDRRYVIDARPVSYEPESSTSF